MSGQLEVCIDGRFGGICEIGFDVTDALVACNVLGYTDGESH